MRHLLISRRRCISKICPITFIIALTCWQPINSLSISGNDWAASGGAVSESLHLSGQGSCSTALKVFAVPMPALLKGCPKGMYTATLHVGNQDLEVLIHTGSSQLVLFGESCMGCSPQMKRYRPMATSTDLSMRDGAQFGGSSAGAYGDVYLDSISVAGATVVNVSESVPLALISAYLSGVDRDVWGL